MADEALAAGDPSSASTVEGAAQPLREIERLRSASAHLQSDLEAAVTQAGMLQDTVDELQGLRARLEAQIEDLEGKLSALAAEKAEEAALLQREVERLRSERDHLQGDLEAAVTQVGMLQAAVDELQGSRASSDAQIRELEGKLSALAVEKADEGRRAEAERRVLEAVSTRASELEGEVSRLQHDLIAAMSEADEANAEVRGLKESEQRLEGKVKKLVGEKEASDTKKGEAEERIFELEGKVKSLEKELESLSDKKEKESVKMKLAVAELEEKVRAYNTNLEKMREVQNGNKSADDGSDKQKVGMGDEIWGIKFPWKLVAASTGVAMVVTAATCYLHCTKSRSN